MPEAVTHDSHQASAAARDPNTLKRHQQHSLRKHSTTQSQGTFSTYQSRSSLIGVQPAKKLLLLLSILFFLFVNGIWFSWDSSLMTREAAVLGFFMNTSWPVISFRTYEKSKEDNFGVDHCPEEASQLALELGGSMYRSCQANVNSCFISLLKLEF